VTARLLGLVLLGLLAGCAGAFQGQLPTDVERCEFQGGWFSAGICHTRGGQ